MNIGEIGRTFLSISVRRHPYRGQGFGGAVHQPGIHADYGHHRR